MDRTEAELETFRKQWWEEVSSRTKSKQATVRGRSLSSAQSASGAHIPKKSVEATALPEPRRAAYEGLGETASPSYHDLEEEESRRRLKDDVVESSQAPMRKEPKSALEHYERAVERESQGNLGESVHLYRKAFRLDLRVHETYKNKHFPPSAAFNSPKATTSNPSSAPVTVPSTAHHSLNGFPSSISDLISDFSKLSIPSEPPPTDRSPPPPCPIAAIPEEILVEILMYAAIIDLASLARIAQACKRLAYLIMTEERIWKRIALGHEYGFAAMLYRFICDVHWRPLIRTAEGGRLLPDYTSRTGFDPALPSPILTHLPLTPTYPSYRLMFRARPRLRFNGCYISTVNYTRPGASSANQLTWSSPVLIVTYYRYLRFFRDGTVISLLTTAEPADVVHHLSKENMHDHHASSALPAAVMKHALRGRWRLSGALDLRAGSADTARIEEMEAEGDVHVETEGVVSHYMYKMQFALGSSGRGARNNKLSWKGYWSYNRLTDDCWDNGLKNDRAFYWTRVKSYGKGMQSTYAEQG